jgi:hypothetical protein
VPAAKVTSPLSASGSSLRIVSTYSVVIGATSRFSTVGSLVPSHGPTLSRFTHAWTSLGRIEDSARSPTVGTHAGAASSQRGLPSSADAPAPRGTARRTS